MISFNSIKSILNHIVLELKPYLLRKVNDLFVIT
jgi:hypothetical protein